MPRTQLPLLSPSAPPLPLDDLVVRVDAALRPGPPGNLIRVVGDPPEIAYLGLGGGHPLDILLGFRAPPTWLAIGVHCRGRAVAVDPTPPDALVMPGGDHPADDDGPVVVTALVDRTGRGAGLMRQGSLTTRLDGAAEGVVGDACRRALGLATAPAPATTAELWLRIWLDRVVEAVTFADDPGRYACWEAIAALHPAAGPVPGGEATLGPMPLDSPWAAAEAIVALAEVWPWSRLRHTPDVVDVAAPPISRAVAAWMDDGMYARTVLAELASLPLLLHTAARLVPLPVLDDLEETVVVVGMGDQTRQVAR